MGNDPHLSMGCTRCHGGNSGAGEKDVAHEGMVKRPSENVAMCGQCHGKIAENYAKALHYTSAGQRHGVMPRFSKKEAAMFDKKVFEQSCRSCHASCGSCHVKSPPVMGISLGLVKGHAFVRRDEGKTCAFCHGGRVYPEYTGEYSGLTDVHYQKGMMCMDCHTKEEMHGDGRRYASKQEVKQRPSCTKCHKEISSSRLRIRVAHNVHRGRVSCYGCHAAGQYRNCSDCHGGESKAKPGFMLGKNPRNSSEVTTLRLVPAVRDTFINHGISQENYDDLPNYWNTPAHTIRKRTDRTKSCDVCHTEKKYFLGVDDLPKGLSKANRGLIHTPKPITR